MQLKYKVTRLVVLASFALAGAAIAQTTPPTDQAQAPSQTPPGPTNPTDQSTVPSPQPGPAETTGVAGGTSGGRQKAEEEIVVTGSRVRRKDLTTPAPVTVINREQISSSGIAAVGDFLQQMPEQGGATNTNVNNAGSGDTQISLRNLGASRTLVLVDGKRWVNSSAGGVGSSVDLNSVPTSAIERIEVLKDGASAVYGSDAIGGVVNIITRRRVNTTELSAYGGITPHNDAQQYDIAATSGIAGDKGSFMFNAEYFDQKSMFASKRDWATKALSYDYLSGTVEPGGSGTIPQGRARVDLADPSCASNPLCSALKATYGAGIPVSSKGVQATYFMPVGTSALPACSGAVSKANWGSCQVDGWRPYIASGATNDQYNYQAVNYLITPNTRISLFTNGDYHVSDFARAYFQGSFVNRSAQTDLAPEPLVTSSFGIVVSKDNPYNPFGQDLTDVRRRLVEYSGRLQGYDVDTFRAVAGMDGTLPDAFGPLSGVFWDVSFNYGRSNGTTSNFGSLNVQDVANGLGSSCPPEATNCVPVNLLGGPGTLTPEMITALGGYRGIAQSWNQIGAVQANASAELFKLASERPVGLAAGYEYRAYYGGYEPDPIGAAGLSFDYNSQPTRGSYHVNEGYAELNVPLISNAPLAEDVELSGAARVFDYSSFGSDWTYKLGARWRPIRDVTLRGTWSTGFRAPDISDLYTGQLPSAEPARDPCQNASPSSDVGKRCAQFATNQGSSADKVVGNGDNSVQLNSTVGGNPQLKPEKAQIGTIGVVFEPTMVRGFSATFDYYNIKVTENLGFITAPVILSGCYTGGNDQYCSLIQRDPTTGFIRNIIDVEQNVGSAQTSGVDFALRYTLPTDVGRFGFLFDSTYLIYYRQTLANGQVISAAGNYDLGSGSAVSNLTPKVKFNAGINYGLAGLNVGLRGRYIGGFDECADSDGTSAGGGQCSNPQYFDAEGNNVPKGTPGATTLPAHHVSAYTTFDLFASYLVKSSFGNTTLSAGVRNVADAKPATVYNAFLSYTDPGYDLVGRFVYARLTHQF